MVAHPHLLRKIEKQSPFTRIDGTTLLDEQVSSTVLNGQINTKPGMLSLFKIHNTIARFDFFLFRSH
jgi:hypothetical protein